MSNQVQNMINHVLGDGARSAKFRCFISAPIGSSSEKNRELDTLCKAASFPGKATETMEYKYKGKTILIPGQEKYNQTIELVFYLEENHTNRIYFEDWMSAFHFDNYNGTSKNSGNDLKANIKNTVIDTLAMSVGITAGSKPNKPLGVVGISQLNYDMDTELKQYIMYNAFPIEISSIPLSADGVNTVLEYTVTFAYTHYSIDLVNSTGEDIANKVKSAVQELAIDAVAFVANKIANIGAVKDFTKGLSDSLGGFNSYINTSIDKTTTSIKNFLG